ncbi:DUF2530 domain-containing protein [Nocardioides nematodiphilus]|uniref:DUF2530 domain-containing protein n=1 Tax=Nocardioides nematodiphilus TaxID=2849669 RepID=UPI001CD9D953|nr:DUF2530 domain-containing protein [Nocardioides nematodiphilus]MCA1981375.1 DUF2530 domain-containing protein [Nocardioides nematodiphilus]
MQQEKRPAVAEIEPIDVDGVRAVEIGTLLWLIAFVGMLPFYGRLRDDGRGWWLWTCLAGFGLGALGVEYCRRRRARRQAAD